MEDLHSLSLPLETAVMMSATKYLQHPLQYLLQSLSLPNQNLRNRREVKVQQKPCLILINLLMNPTKIAKSITKVRNQVHVNKKLIREKKLLNGLTRKSYPTVAQQLRKVWNLMKTRRI